MSINPLLVIIGIIVIIVLIDASRNRILFNIGLRNLKRRKTNTIIVILGLMIGTAIISSSFGIGDTMDNFIQDEVYSDYQETDITVYNRTFAGEYVNIPTSTYLDFKEDVESMDKVEGVTGEVHGSVSIYNPDSLLTVTSARAMGLNESEGVHFGSITAAGEKVEINLEEDEIYIDEPLADDLEAEVGGQITVFSKVYQSGRQFTVKEIVDNKGRAAWGGEGKILVTLGQARDMFGLNRSVNFIKISCVGGVEEGNKYSGSVADEVRELIKEDEDYNLLEVQNVKQEDLESFQESISMFSDLFLVFGTFSIIAGVVLTINIFVMLGEERKSESGMSRAIGMKRKSLIKVFTYEGLFYSIGASIVGALVGIVITYIIFYILGDVFAGFGASSQISTYFDYKLSSLITSFSAGFLITMITILATTYRISNINIVRAIRDIPEPPISKKSKKLLILAGISIVVGVLLILYYMQTYQERWLMTGVSVIILGASTILRRWTGDRIAYTVAALALLLFWLAPLPTSEASTGDIDMFILSGLFMVTAGVMLVMLNGTIITHLFELCCRAGSGFKAVILTGISHPVKERFRTAMTMFIFALIIFSITVMGMIVAIFDTNIDMIIEDQSGGYDIIGFCDTQRPIENMHERVVMSDELDIDDFKRIDHAAVGYVATNQSQNGRVSRQMVIGVGSNFVANNTFGFADYLDEYDSTDEVWNAVLEDPDLVIGPAGGQSMGPPGMGTEFGLGDNISFMDIDGGIRQKQIIGQLNQSFLNGYFMSRDTAAQEFNITATSVFFYDVNEGADDEQIAKDLEREFVANGFQPIVLSTIIEQITSTMYLFFDLFSGYMGLGLIVGIAGLGIISLRAVHERRLEIGMMRAIGFKRSMIRYAFLIENSFITIMGILIGSILGIAIGWIIWNDSFRSMGWVFTIPYTRILFIGILAYGIMLVTAIPSAAKASRVSPAEALRFD